MFLEEWINQKQAQMCKLRRDASYIIVINNSYTNIYSLWQYSSLMQLLNSLSQVVCSQKSQPWVCSLAISTGYQLPNRKWKFSKIRCETTKMQTLSNQKNSERFTCIMKKRKRTKGFKKIQIPLIEGTSGSLDMDKLKEDSIKNNSKIQTQELKFRHQVLNEMF